ncbi:hypothetical protein PAAG_11704 [Paracoccidioides lutzii Pb01]|uniref:Uncharacterized protein n=1 Tax=Paracoccidioides lutzii (strain ATCC MYA-826 / Pb01) TaxID=502779 RepID=A0A0A2V1A2_PARBA|nr:hypothetical protein PAAG_11704 [Paracoccidioides lutzii Pb01]KGQ01576.1 hypothetical protein PAAG_11704 [Paracoccidioides lutzii Pb01]
MTGSTGWRLRGIGADFPKAVLRYHKRAFSAVIQVEEFPEDFPENPLRGSYIPPGQLGTLWWRDHTDLVIPVHPLTKYFASFSFLVMVTLNPIPGMKQFDTLVYYVCNTSTDTSTLTISALIVLPLLQYNLPHLHLPQALAIYSGYLSPYLSPTTTTSTSWSATTTLTSSDQLGSLDGGCAAYVICPPIRLSQRITYRACNPPLPFAPG